MRAERIAIFDEILNYSTVSVEIEYISRSMKCFSLTVRVINVPVATCVIK